MTMQYNMILKTFGLRSNSNANSKWPVFTHEQGKHYNFKGMKRIVLCGAPHLPSL